MPASLTFELIQQVSLWFSTMVYATLLAIAASLTFEFPISALQKLLFGK
jgi:hypothetical protein